MASGFLNAQEALTLEKSLSAGIPADKLPQIVVACKLNAVNPILAAHFIGSILRDRSDTSKDRKECQALVGCLFGTCSRIAMKNILPVELHKTWLGPITRPMASWTLYVTH